MCRSIKCLAHFEPPASDHEIREAAIQFVRKLSGANRPTRANEEAFDRAVDDVTAAASRLLGSLTSSAPPRNREIEAQKVRERARQRFARAPLAAAASRNRVLD
jgi:hypothetical protein